jgi:hypothetical protein
MNIIKKEKKKITAQAVENTLIVSNLDRSF